MITSICANVTGTVKSVETRSIVANESGNTHEVTTVKIVCVNENGEIVRRVKAEAWDDKQAKLSTLTPGQVVKVQGRPEPESIWTNEGPIPFITLHATKVKLMDEQAPQGVEAIAHIKVTYRANTVTQTPKGNLVVNASGKILEKQEDGSYTDRERVDVEAWNERIGIMKNIAARDFANVKGELFADTYVRPDGSTVDHFTIKNPTLVRRTFRPAPRQ